MIETGVQKAAVLMLALGEDEAAEVMKFLSPREVQALGGAMSTMKGIQSQELEQVLAEFRELTEQNTSIGIDSDDYIRSVLTKALGDDKASSLLNRILGAREASGIESLKWMDGQSVAELIRNEHPQITAPIAKRLQRQVLDPVPAGIQYLSFRLAARRIALAQAGIVSISGSSFFFFPARDGG